MDHPAGHLKELWMDEFRENSHLVLSRRPHLCREADRDSGFFVPVRPAPPAKYGLAALNFGTGGPLTALATVGGESAVQHSRV
jgi:hypothetical protein